MYINNTNEDLRSIKTEKALYDALFSLLKKQNFKKTTVKNICEEAIISRAAFYAHFIDKYDLLKQWLTDLWLKKFGTGICYEQLEQAVNCHLNEIKRILKNLVYDAENETFTVIFDFIISVKKLTVDKSCSKEIYQKNVVLSNFYAGGIISYLLWQIKNEFPASVPLMNKDVYQMIKEFQTKQPNKTEKQEAISQ